MKPYPTWFVVPDEVGEAIEKMIQLGQLAKPKNS
jgi:hypothetical protein